MMRWIGQVVGGPEIPTWFRWLAIVMIALPLVISIPGCGGCTLDPEKRKQLEEERKKKEREAAAQKPKPPFDPFVTTVWPATRDREEDDVLVRVKPGHWMQVTQRTRANNEDFNGELLTRCVDRRSEKIELQRSPYQLSSSRPVSLPRANVRELSVPIFFPHMTSRDYQQLNIQTQLLSRGGMREVTPGAIQPTDSLKAQQYYAVVVATSPERYTHLPKLASFSPPYDISQSTGLQVDYLVSLPVVDTRVPLPSHPLAWTSIAYILWDEVAPDKLTTAQQDGLVDWLHWGGQLIVIGPRSLPSLRASFLADYLPVEAEDTVAIDALKLEEINRHWSYEPNADAPSEAMYQLISPEQNPIQRVTMKTKGNGQFVPNTAELVAESRVGRGRIAVTAIGLDEFHFRNWKGFDGFVNGALLRRPGRTFDKSSDESQVAKWTRYPQLGKDARINCSLRYFSRDATLAGGVYRELPVTAEVSEVRAEEPESAYVSSNAGSRNGRSHVWMLSAGNTPYEGYREGSVAGVGGWDDFCDVAIEARNSLQRAAGISVPNGRFVASVLGIYLVCLVPLNWLVFRLMGRVEWAWFAAPVIAVLGAIGVIRSAHLDIGFVRSRTEIAVVELQPNHSRAHVCRFTGLYTSLSTSYAANFDGTTSLAMPFSTDPPDDRLRQQPRREAEFRLDDSASLQGFSVLSNSTGMMRSESILKVQGPCRLEGRDFDNTLLKNDSEFDLRQVIVVANIGGQLHAAFVDQLAAGQQASITLAEVSSPEDIDSFLEKSQVTASSTPETEVSLRGLYQLAINRATLQEGDCRLAGWSDQEVRGMELRPRPNQETFRTFVVSNLRYGMWGPPENDANYLTVLPR